MENIFKKLVYTSVGFASLTYKKMEETIDDLLKRGKLSEDEGKEILSSFQKATDKTKEELEQDLKSVMEKLLRKMNIPDSNSIAELEQRVAALEMLHKQEAIEKERMEKPPSGHASKPDSGTEGLKESPDNPQPSSRAQDKLGKEDPHSPERNDGPKPII